MHYRFYMIGQWLAQKLPLDACYALAAFFGAAFYVFSHRDREALKDNLRVVLGRHASKKNLNNCARMVYINFAKYLVDFLKSPKLDAEYMKKNVVLQGRENIDIALDQNKGAILLSSHLGNWELGGAVVASLGYKVNAIALDHTEDKVTNFFIKQREKYGVRVIRIGAALKKCFLTLKRNELLGILGDRDFSESGVKVKFFGRDTLIPKGPAFFSIRTAAPIVPTFVLRLRGCKHRIVFGKPFTFAASGNTEADIKKFVGKYIGVIQRQIRSHPSQWYLFRRVWGEK